MDQRQRAKQARPAGACSGIVEELLLPPVVPDWNKQLRQAIRLTRLIDRHLDSEARGRRPRPGACVAPAGLGPEERVSMLAELLAATRSRAHP